MVKKRLSLKDELGILCYCDGACTGNPGPGGWGAIVRTADGLVRELGGAESPTTNNRMELQGAIHALNLVRNQREVPVAVFTDSSYVIQGITSWVHGWRRRGWIKQDGEKVVNRDLWEELSALTDARKDTGPASFFHVRGHSGVPGNERCDRISVAFARGDRPGLYRGPATEYRIDLTPPEPVPEDENAPPKPRGPRIAAPAGPSTYLSLVDGRLQRHQTWPECQAVVNGRSGARYKKCKSADEEKATLGSWGCGGQEPE